jgi:predicted MPP superfamily phosphohydrolase
MKYNETSRTYQIVTSEKTKTKKYIIAVSLSDTYAPENLYTFTVDIKQLKNELPLIIIMNP